jgi:hypothetical protein
MKSGNANSSHIINRDYARVASTDPSLATSSSQQPLPPVSQLLPTSPTSSSPPPDRDIQAPQNVPSRTVLEKVTDKAMAAVWVLVAVLVMHWTDSLRVFLLRSSTTTTSSKTANPMLMQCVAIGFGINTVLVLYLIVYLPYVKGLHDSSAWDVYCPRIIPTITLTSVITAGLLIRATWSVWGFLSPLILGIEAMGCLFLLHFIPVLPQS